MYAAMTKDKGNDADGRFSAACWSDGLPEGVYIFCPCLLVFIFGARTFLLFVMRREIIILDRIIEKDSTGEGNRDHDQSIQ